MLRSAISYGRLMRESTDRIESALQSDDSHEQWLAQRVLENPSAWNQWESEHAGLMRLVAVSGFPRTQVAILKKATLRLVERKALFEYLRAQSVRGDMRQKIFAYFHPARSYVNAVVGEHAVYLRKACSFLCTSHVGIELVHDEGFLDPMQRYEALYREYFQFFCDTHFADESSGLESSLLPLLKQGLEDCRRSIMDPDVRPKRRFATDLFRRRTPPVSATA